MTWLWITLVAWVVLSFPIAVVVGRMFARADRHIRN